MASLIISEFRDGQWTIVAQPTVAVPDGMEGTLQAGGEAMDAETQRRIPYGIQARIRVREIEAGKLRLSMHVSQGTLDETEDSSFVIREWSLHCVRTIAPGEQVEFELGSDRKVAVRLSPVNPRR